jgi:hypothetical protein
VLALLLAGLFLYKAIEEHAVDLVWSMIYVLVGLDYLFEGRS